MAEAGMSVHEHRAEAPTDGAKVAVITVTTSRAPSDDRSGDLIVGRLELDGHVLVARRLVADDVDAIRGAVRELRLKGAQVIVLTGGTGLSTRDLTPEALEPLFHRTIPGFGELFRMLSFQEVGSAAMLSRATAGMIGGTLVFALPGSVKACELAMDKLILPEIGHMLGQVAKEERAGLVSDAAVEEVARAGMTRVAVSPDPPAPIPEDEPGGRWREAIRAHEGRVEQGPPPPLPEPIARLASVTSVLDTAGERATLVLEDGRRLGLYGWPDLRRPGSKVIAVGDGAPLAEVVALHRHPQLTGTTVFGGLLPDPLGAAETAEAITGRAAPFDAPLFAVSGDAVWLRDGERAVKWDGSKERKDGTCKQVLASLLMEWHQR